MKDTGLWPALRQGKCHLQRMQFYASQSVGTCLPCRVNPGSSLGVAPDPLRPHAQTSYLSLVVLSTRADAWVLLSSDWKPSTSQ